MKNRNLEHKDDWETPQYILEQYVYPLIGNNYFDPCPLNATFDGLSIDWGGEAFVNPPYSRILKEKFIHKALEQSKKGCKVVMLLPVSTSTKIFHEVILPNCKIIFIKGRVKFKGYNTFGEKVVNKCGMHDSMIVTFNI